MRTDRNRAKCERGKENEWMNWQVSEWKEEKWVKHSLNRKVIRFLLKALSPVRSFGTFFSSYFFYYFFFLFFFLFPNNNKVVLSSFLHFASFGFHSHVTAVTVIRSAFDFQFILFGEKLKAFLSIFKRNINWYLYLFIHCTLPDFESLTNIHHTFTMLPISRVRWWFSF